MASVRSRARLEASMVSPGISPGLSWWALNSIKPAVTTFARWLFLLRSATLMASSILPSRSAPATAGANARDCLRAALKAMARSIITPIDQPDMTKRMMTTAFAGIPIWCHSEIGSQPTAACSWKTQVAAVDMCARASVARLATNMSCFPPGAGRIRQIVLPIELSGAHPNALPVPHQLHDRYLTAGQGEVDRNLGFHFHWLAVQDVRFVLPLLHCFDGGRSQHRVATDQAQVLDRTILADFGLQQH